MHTIVAIFVTIMATFVIGATKRTGRFVNIRHFSKFHLLKMSTGQVAVSSMQIPDIDGSPKDVYFVDKGTDHTKVPLVLLGGTAQTIDTFTPHINQIAKSRRLIIPELRGQGRTTLDPSHCTIEQLVKDLSNILNNLGVQDIHLGGFSFGGRVALAYAAHNQQRVKRLAVTAIPLTRPTLGKIILDSWMDGLGRGNMRECAWSFIINGYSTEFLEKNAERLSLYVDMVTNSNDPNKVFNLIKQSGKAFEGEFSIPDCARKIKCPTLVISASQDRIAGLQSVKRLAQVIEESEYVEMNTGHLAPFEDPILWRKHLLEFMNK